MQFQSSNSYEIVKQADVHMAAYSNSFKQDELANDTLIGGNNTQKVYFYSK